MDPIQSRDNCPSLKDSSRSQNSTRTSFSNLEQVLQLESAVGTIERDLLQPQTDQSQQRLLLGSVLHRHLSARLEETGLTPERILERPPLILRTPQVEIRTSTPTNSPPSPPLPPRQCQSIGLDIPPRPCSPTCSDLSSINGEVFSETEVTEPVLSEEFRAPGSISQGRSNSINIMEAAATEIDRKSTTLNRLMRNFTLLDVSRSGIKNGEFDTEFNRIKDLCIDTVEDIEDMVRIHKDNMETSQIDHWTGQIRIIESTVGKYKIDMRKKRDEVEEEAEYSRNTASAASISRDFGSMTIGQSQSDRRNEKLAEAKELFEQVVSMCSDLSAEINRIADWESEADLTVSRTMKKLQGWKKDLKEIESVNRKLRILVKSNGLTNTELSIDSAEAYVSKVVDELNTTTHEVEKQDDERALYTLDTSKADPVKLPTFGGKEDEDFSLFKEEVKRAFLSNKTCRADQLSKLRECLKDHPKNLVPKMSTTTIEDAWEVLSNAYGDTKRVMKYYMKAIGELGKFPHKSNPGGLRSQIEWYIKLESLMKRIMELADRDRKLQNQAYGDTTQEAIINLFPIEEQMKLVVLPGEEKQKLEAILKDLVVRRECLQALMKIHIPIPKKTPIAAAAFAGESDDSASISSPSGQGTASGNSETFDVKGLVAFDPPRRDPDCRICQTLEENGDTEYIYDDHIHSFPSGCPRYMAMSIEQRNDTAAKAKLCLKCHDPKYFFQKSDSQNQRHNCNIRPGRNKGKFTCTEPACLTHMWVCLKHKGQNKEALKKFKNEYRTKYNMEFAFMVGNPRVSIANPRGVKRKLSIPNNIKAAGKGQAQVKETKASLGNPAPLSAQCGNGSMSSSQAQKKLKWKLKDKNVSDELRPVPKGKAQFMLGHSKGKSRNLLTLYDTGCHSVLFAKGVPEKELCPAVRKTKGPFLVNAVGDTSVTVNDEWMCSISLTDGTRQSLEGWDVDKITAALPYIKMKQAENDIKSSKPDDEELQKLGVEPVIGGQVDILLGITYNSIFPTSVHNLDNGLTIYKLQIKPFDKKYNCVIGGPHDSFQFMAEQTNSTRMVFVNLMRQLENYRSMGPPSISKCLMTVEDLEFAAKHKEWEMETFPSEELKCFPFDDDQSHFDEEIDALKLEEIDGTGNITHNSDVSCSNCGVCVVMLKSTKDLLDGVRALPAKTDEDDEYLSSLRKLQHAQHEGLNIEYRCPRCRSCGDCRRSHETERISLREEAEDLMIWDSVEIDKPNKRIICHLPLRGEEEEFLSSNRDIALKILDKQCLKYSKDEETKKVITKAFDKLIKNKQMALWSDLTDEQRKIIEAKKIQHYIPWRAVFKQSLSTPARPVFDASTKTKLRDDKSGGRCLNDLVVKGRIVTLNLVKMLLRFQTGKAAVQGDLKQFYASIKLVESQWNLQRVLLRKDLDLKSEVLECVIKTLIWGVKSV